MPTELSVIIGSNLAQLLEDADIEDLRELADILGVTYQVLGGLAVLIISCVLVALLSKVTVKAHFPVRLYICLRSNIAGHGSPNTFYVVIFYIILDI